MFDFKSTAYCENEITDYVDKAETLEDFCKRKNTNEGNMECFQSCLCEPIKVNINL